MIRWLSVAWLCLVLPAGPAGCAVAPSSSSVQCPEAPSAPVAATPPATEPPATEAELEAIHHRLATAYRTNDVPMLERMISSDHLHNNVFGMIQGKDALLGDMRSGTLVFRAYEITSSRWFIRGDLAMVTGTLRAEAERAGKPVPSAEFRFTRVFERRDGEWQELLFHNTMVVAPPGRP